MRLIDVPMLENDIGAATVGEFLKTLLITLWEEGEGFSGKRPFGNSDWQYQVYASLIKAGCIIGKFDEDGYINDADYQKADRIIKDAVREVFDAVPVVRCKDCKWYKDFGSYYRLLDCIHRDGLSFANEDNFCSYGERKDDD